MNSSQFEWRITEFPCGREWEIGLEFKEEKINTASMVIVHFDLVFGHFEPEMLWGVEGYEEIHLFLRDDAIEPGLVSLHDALGE